MRKLLSLFALWRDPDWRKLFIVCAVIVLIAAAGVQMDRINPFAVYNIWNVTREPGATADLQIQSCLTNRIPTGGICDARGYGATTQTLASLTTVNAKQKLLFDPATNFQAATSSQNGFIVEPEGFVDGLTFDCSNQPSYSGIVVQNDTAAQYSVNSSSPLGATRVQNVQSTKACQSVPTGTLVKLNSTSSGTGIYQFALVNIAANGLQDGLALAASNSGFVNGLRIINFVGHQNINCIHRTLGTSGQINSNTFIYSCEAGGVGTNVAQYGQLCDGSTGTSISTGNRFIGDDWDYNVTGTPFREATTACRADYWMGEIDGTPTDVNSGNYWLINPNQNLLKASSASAVFGSYGSPLTLNASNGQLNLDSSGNNFVNTDGANSVYIKNNGGLTYFYSGGGAGSQVASIDSSGKGAFSGGLVASGTSLIKTGSTTVASLPSAASNSGAMILVTDSTAVASEGQTCVGGSSNKAVAISNGSIWKCF